MQLREGQTEVAALLSELRASAEVWRGALSVPAAASARSGTNAVNAFTDFNRGAQAADRASSAAETGSSPAVGAPANETPGASRRRAASSGSGLDSILRMIQSTFGRLAGSLRGGAGRRDPNRRSESSRVLAEGSDGLSDLLSRLRGGGAGPMQGARGRDTGSSLREGFSNEVAGAPLGLRESPLTTFTRRASAGAPASPLQTLLGRGLDRATAFEQDMSEPARSDSTGELPAIDTVDLVDIAGQFQQAPSPLRLTDDNGQTLILRKILEEQERLQASISRLNSRPSTFS